MNRKHLNALLAAGLITPAQHSAALSAGRMPRLELELPALVRLAESTGTDAPAARSLVGTIATYGELVRSHGIILEAGSLHPREPLSRVKLLLDHDPARPVGYMTALDPVTLEATFEVPASDDGDHALDYAAKGLRDGLSVGFGIEEYTFDDNYVMHVYSSELYETSLVSIPAIADAGVTNVAAALRGSTATNQGEALMNEAQIRAAFAAGTISAEQRDAALAVLGVAVPAELAAGPVSNGSATPVAVVERPRSFAQLAADVVDAASSRDLRAVTMALEAFVPEPGAAPAAGDAADAYLGETGLGEIWQAHKDGRPTIDSLGGTADLASPTLEGWGWDVLPKPQKYAGKGAEVPTNKPRTKKFGPVEAERWAGGWRLDRIFSDLGTPELVGSFWNLAVQQYQADSDFDVAAKLYAAATPVLALDGVTVAAPTSALEAVAAIARNFRKIGASLDVVKLAEDVFEDFAELKVADIPAWLVKDLGLDVRSGAATINPGLTFEADDSLELGEVLGYDRRSAKPYEKTPFRVEAIAVANGALDLGFYSYGALWVNDARAIKKATVSL